MFARLALIFAYGLSRSLFRSFLLRAMWIDTHCHLDADELAVDREAIVAQAKQVKLQAIVVPAVSRQNFQTVTDLAIQHNCVRHALGIHPMYEPTAHDDDLAVLNDILALQMATSKRPVALGEIGLDYFVPTQNIARQQDFFVAQLKLAIAYDLPVILHVRRAVDDVLKYLRRYPQRGGIAHAFNGSMQQAEAFIKLGFKLGFGGAMTYMRALNIRKLAKELPLEAIVLETDAPDIPPEWLGKQGINTPLELPKIGEILAEIRGLELSQVAEITSKNALQALPKMADLCTSPQVLL